MKYCTNCGKPIEITDKFCVNCGCSLEPSGPVPPREEPASDASEQSSIATEKEGDARNCSERKKGGRLSFGNRTIILASIVALVVLVVAFVFMARIWSREANEKMISLPNGVNLVLRAVPNGLWFGKYEVTQAQWEAVMGENPSEFKGADNPVENVSWDDCQAFLKKLNALPDVKKSGLTFRLPTEEEWQYACRADATGDYCKLASGAEITEETLGQVAWFADNSDEKTHPVGQKKPNAFGLYDMHGNVLEWTSTAVGEHRVLRGAGWIDSARCCESSYRLRFSPVFRLPFHGFRLCADAEEKTSCLDEESGIIDLDIILALINHSEGTASDSPDLMKTQRTIELLNGLDHPMSILLRANGKQKSVTVSSREDVGEAIYDFVESLPDGPGKEELRKLFEDQAQNSPSTTSISTIETIYANMVQIPGKNYMMSKYEVTQAQWEAVMGENPSHFKGTDNPVESVSWDDCQAFLKKLNALPVVKESGLTFRLPTDAEWEAACRAGATEDYCRLANGPEITESTLGEVAWFEDNSDETTHPVGRKEPNAFGLYDMHGNVWEWTNTADGGDRVISGGSWWDWASFCQASFRHRISRSDRNYYIGFRLCADSKTDNSLANKLEASRAEHGSKAAPSATIDSTIETLCANMVQIPGKNYKMGKYEVTQTQWETVMGKNPSHFKGENNPVENVSWDDCQVFLKKLNALPAVKKSGMEFRLPTDAEWEAACRAGATGNYCLLADGTEITDSTLGQVAWFDPNSDWMTHPVGRKKPNAFGLYDMHGNVWEWTLTADGESRTRRGGNWGSAARRCESSYRDRFSPGRRDNNLGFRLCADAEEKTLCLDEESRIIDLDIILALINHSEGTANDSPDLMKTQRTIELLTGLDHPMSILLRANGKQQSVTVSSEEDVGEAIYDFVESLPDGPGKEELRKLFEDQAQNSPSTTNISTIETICANMVQIPGKNYKMSKYEVTQAQWEAVMGENPSHFKGKNNPVENVSWDDCQVFLEKLNELPAVKESGLTFRLPVEKEWEYACRAGATGDYCKLANGTEITESTLGEVAWFKDNTDKKTHPVGQKKPNAFGLYDMHGNVWEWTQTADGEDRIDRGGGWGSRASPYCKSSNKRWNSPFDRYVDLGFRLCASDSDNEDFEEDEEEFEDNAEDKDVEDGDEESEDEDIEEDEEEPADDAEVEEDDEEFEDNAEDEDIEEAEEEFEDDADEDIEEDEEESGWSWTFPTL